VPLDFPARELERQMAVVRPQFENNYFTETCRGSEAGSYLRLIYFVYHSTLGLRVIQKKKVRPGSAPAQSRSFFVFFFTLVTGPRRSLSLNLSDTRVYGPQIRARSFQHHPPSNVIRCDRLCFRLGYQRDTLTREREGAAVPRRARI